MGPGPTQALAAAVLRLLAEHGNGDWTDRELRERLGVLSRIYWFDQAARTSRLDSVSVVIRQDQPSASVERWRAAESV
jgi:predicted Zn-dependent peptidase